MSRDRCRRSRAGRAGALLGSALILGSCRVAPSPEEAVGRQAVGEPYRLGGLWYYPREDFALVETGLATVIPANAAGRRTANGERFDPRALMAAHRTVQLPAVLRVTNLEAGRELLVRVNDRGPAEPGRVVALSPRAAELLGIVPNRPAQVRIAVEADASRGVAAGLPGAAPALAIATAPTVGVQREDLAPPPGAAQSARVREARPGPAVAVAAAPATAAALVELPQVATPVTARPGVLFVQLGTFQGGDAARRQAAALAGARAEPFSPPGGARRPEWRVRLGPFASVAEADSALERVLRAGVSEARILME